MTERAAAPARPLGRVPAGFDLMAMPGLGRLLRWRRIRSALQLPLLLLAALMVFDGLTGPQLAPKNLATVLAWVQYRGLLILVLLVAGNFFCLACPFMLPRNLARRLLRPARMWPRRLRNKWPAIGLFASILFVYELFDLWATPRWTAWLVVAYFAGALVLDSVFRGAPFCKYVCPIGQFNFVSSLVSPLEVRIRDAQVCAACRTKDCIKGRQSPIADSDIRSSIPLRGCELWLFQQQKYGNMDCTFCLDCVHACPYDNVGIRARLPASELWEDPFRSGVGYFSRRFDLTALIVLFTFGALLNAFGMVSPVYAVERWLAGVLGVSSEAPVLGVIFLVGLVIEPVVLLGLAGWATRRWAGMSGSLLQVVTRYAYTLVPLGAGVWAAHYGFHLLTGFWTFIPVVQTFLADIIGPVLGAPRWDLGPLLPAAWLYPLELGFMGLGWLGSLLVAYRLASEDAPTRRWRAFLPWAALATLLLLAALWLMAQPMEMRATFLGG